jgi:phospholipase/carboxylesterase
MDVKARLVVPRGIERCHDGYCWFRARGRAELGSAALGQGILHAADAVAATLKQLAAERPTLGKAVVTGFSQGGAVSFALALHHPDLVGAAFPIGGWIPTSILPRSSEAARIPPILALHGEADPRVPIEPTREAVSALSRLGVRAELQSYPQVEHLLTPRMLRDLSRLIRSALSRCVDLQSRRRPRHPHDVDPRGVPLTCRDGRHDS